MFLVVPCPYGLGISVGAIKTIRGAQKLRKIDAVESVAMVVIFAPDKEISIQMIDINYNRRSHAELYNFKAEGQINLSSPIGLAALVEWEAMVNGLKLFISTARR
jgi:hypothetical protein